MAYLSYQGPKLSDLEFLPVTPHPRKPDPEQPPLRVTSTAPHPHLVSAQAVLFLTNHPHTDISSSF